MPELIVDILAGIGVVGISLIWYFYFYSAMKKEYKRKGGRGDASMILKWIMGGRMGSWLV